MLVSPLQINNFPSYTSGEVTIDPSAAIAPGVVLKAELNSRIAIAAGVCIGMGTIIHAYNGSIEVDAGATLGAAVLLVGKVKIGSNACIGASTTIHNSSIEGQQIIAPGSLIGETDRQIAETSTELLDNGATSHSLKESESALAQLTESIPTEVDPPAPSLAVPESVANSPNQIVYGKSSLHNLLSTLFPHSQSLNTLNDAPKPDNNT